MICKFLAIYCVSDADITGFFNWRQNCVLNWNTQLLRWWCYFPQTCWIQVERLQNWLERLRKSLINLSQCRQRCKWVSFFINHDRFFIWAKPDCLYDNQTMRFCTIALVSFFLVGGFTFIWSWSETWVSAFPDIAGTHRARLTPYAKV